MGANSVTGSMNTGNDNFEENVKMLNKKRLITAVVLILATIVIVITIAGILLLRSSSDTVAMPGATAVGTPNGPATTKSIGPAGGSIASPDGRITVDVPPNAVSGPLDFSIQPITNLAHGGVGSAYRLQPDGLTFATPIKISFDFDAPDLKGFIPEGLAVAYQDRTGVWQSFKTVNINQASKKLTVSTTHFTDFSIWTIKLSPEKATLRVRETLGISLIGCIEKKSVVDRIRTLLGKQHCVFASPAEPSWSVNIGTIAPLGPDNGSAVYKAPAKKPSPNVARVQFMYKLGGIYDVRNCEITIVDRGYTASGESHDESYSGVICDLEKPFTVNGTGLANFAFKFTPSSPTEGKVSYSSSYSPGGAPAIESGSGSYDVKGIDTDRPRIVLTIDKATASVMGHAVQPAMAGSTVVINLTPSGPDECSKK